MAATSTLLILVCLAFVPIAAGLVGLQIFLSRRQSWQPGLCLPAVSLILSCVSAMGLLLYATNDSGAGIIAGIVVIFLIENIPTALFLMIYLLCRRKYRCQNEIEKMNILDL